VGVCTGSSESRPLGPSLPNTGPRAGTRSTIGPSSDARRLLHMHMHNMTNSNTMTTPIAAKRPITAPVWVKKPFDGLDVEVCGSCPDVEVTVCVRTESVVTDELGLGIIILCVCATRQDCALSAQSFQNLVASTSA